MSTLSRRDLARLGVLAAVAVATAPALAACGSGGSGGSGPSAPGTPTPDGPGAELAMSQVARVAPAAGAQAPAVRAVTGFSERIAAALVRAQGSANVVCSPFSIATALGMAVNGARGATRGEMLAVLGGLSVEDLDAGLALLGDLFVSRAGHKTKADGNPAEVALSIANSVWGQRGTPWETPFLDTLARSFGTGVRLVDYRADAEQARRAINAWTSDHTAGTITELVPAGVLTALTRLVLVNAVHLKAPWEQPFEKSATAPAPFTTAAGAAITPPTMAASPHTTSGARGDGWTALALPYAGGELAMTLVRTEVSDAAAQAAWLEQGGLSTVLGALAPVGAATIRMPRFTFHTQSGLRPVLSALGMPTAFSETTADFSGLTTAERLHIDAVLHEAYIAVDEEGTEASAATAVVIGAMSAPLEQLRLVLDRPFLYVIHDLASKAPLFVGRVADPTA